MNFFTNSGLILVSQIFCGSAWFRDYLLFRKQTVSVYRCQSSFLPVLSGVPLNGQHLRPSPLQHVCLDLPSLVQLSNVPLFADDTKCYKSISSVTDCSLFQTDLDFPSNWCSDWNLSFNATKCNFHFQTKSTSIISSNYCVNGSPVATSACHKDLASLSQMIVPGPLTIPILFQGLQISWPAQAHLL